MLNKKSYIDLSENYQAVYEDKFPFVDDDGFPEGFVLSYQESEFKELIDNKKILTMETLWNERLEERLKQGNLFKKILVISNLTNEMIQENFDDQIKTVFNAVAAWNLSVKQKSNGELTLDLIGESDLPDFKLLSSELIKSFTQKKEKLFPEDNRVIFDMILMFDEAFPIIPVIASDLDQKALMSLGVKEGSMLYPQFLETLSSLL